MKSSTLLFRLLFLHGIIFMSIVCNSCKGKSKNYEPTYSTDSAHNKILFFGLPTQKYFESTNLLVNYLNEHLHGVKVRTVASSNFLNYLDRISKRDFEMVIVNGIQALESGRNGYSILCTSIDEESYAGCILVHKDSSINTFSDLKGKTVATPGPPALAGHMMPMVYLNKNGINVNRDLRFSYRESFESVYLNVYLGKCAVGFTATNNWRLFIKERPEIASKVALKWTTPAMIGTVFFLRNDIEKEIAAQLKNVLLNMHLNEWGKKALAKIGYLKFAPADSTDFQPVKQFLREYNDLVENSKQ